MNIESSYGNQETDTEKLIRLKQELIDIQKKLNELGLGKSRTLTMKAMLLKSQIEELEEKISPKK